MNKLEEAAREYLEKKYNVELSDNDESVKNMADFTQQNTLTLDSKIKDGEIVEEPIEIIYEGEPPQSQIDLVEEYYNLPTLRECLRELEISQAGHKMKNKQIEQLTKELDKDKSKYLRLAKKHKKDLKQLQAEKQKVKEMREGIEEVTDLAHGRGFINPSWMFKHLKKLLNQ